MRSLPAAGVTAAVWKPVGLGVGAITAKPAFVVRAPALRKSRLAPQAKPRRESGCCRAALSHSAAAIEHLCVAGPP